MRSRRPEVAVVGGSGLYEFLEDPEQIAVSTPYGDPSAPVSVGEVAGRAVAFLPRHGRHHEFPPHRVNYRANMWALRALGVRRVLAPWSRSAADGAAVRRTAMAWPDGLPSSVTTLTRLSAWRT